MKIIIRLSLLLLACSIAGLFITVGILFKDSFYFVLAAFVFLIWLASIIKRESFPQIGIPKFTPRLNFRDVSKKVKGLKFDKLKKKYSRSKIFNGANLIVTLEIVLTGIFLAYLIVFRLPESNNTNPFIALAYSFFIFFKHYPILIIASFIILLLTNFISYLKFDHKSNLLKGCFVSVFRSITCFVLGSITSVIFVLGFILLFYNSIIAFSGFSPKTLNIHTDKNDIKQIIDTSNIGFELVGISSSSSKTFIINFPFLGRKSDYFIKNLTTSLPDVLLLSSASINSPVYLMNNILVIRQIDKDILQTISPTLVKKLVQKDLSPRYIKSEPDVEIISRQDYLKYREDEINKEIEEITGYINEIKKAMGTAAYNIKVAQNNISTLQGYITLNTQYRDNEYNKCISATWTYYGYYSNYTYRLYSDSYCQNQKAARDQENSEYQAEISTNQKNLAYYQSQYNEFKQYFDQFQNYKAFIESTKDQTPYELGLFESPKSVKVVLDSVSDKDVSNFLETLTHEYIHYSSYVSDERTLPQFFEEGITEYLARKVMSDQLHKDINLGYPVIAKIIGAMTKKISIDQFEDIYFNKSADQLETILDNAYGKNFYKDSELYFAIIPYSPPEEALKFANNIMYKIGEPNLEEKDLYSN